MADRRGRRRTRREGGRVFEILSREGKDDDWMAELREDHLHDGDEVTAPAAAGPALFDRLGVDASPPAADERAVTPGIVDDGPAAGDRPAAGSDGGGVAWEALGEALDAHRSALATLAERLDAVEAALDDVVRRIPPALPRHRPPAPSGAPGPPVGPAAPTVRAVVGALRASAAGSTARIRREVARRLR